MISVIIVSWNARDYLLQCLASIERFGAGLVSEVIVVDNASTDDSVSQVRSRFPATILVESGTNLGFAKGNNLGLRRAAGRYVCLLNSDAELLADCLPTLARYFEAHPEAGLIGPGIVGSTGAPQDAPRGFPTLWNMLAFACGLDSQFPKAAIFNGYLRRGWPNDQIQETEVLSGCFWLARAAAIREVGLLDESFFMYGEDIDWCRSFYERGWKVIYHPGARAIHHGGKSSAQAPTRFYLEMHRANLQYWRKHRGRLASVGYYFVCLLHHLVRVTGHLGLAVGGGREERWSKVQRSWRCFCWLLRLPWRGLERPVSA